MLINDIIAKIDERSSYSFETFILNLMQHHLERQNKPFSGTLSYGILNSKYN
jgi:hypothetical protein